MTPALFEIKVPLDTEYVQLANDMLMLTSALFFAYMVFKSASKKKSIFDDFLEFYIAVLMGTVCYHLIVKKLVQFV
jgi:hypothetical protein